MTSSDENGRETEVRLDDWLDQLEEARELGEPLAPEDLCDDPRLLAELRQRYEKLCRMDDLFGSVQQRDYVEFIEVPTRQGNRSQVIGRYKLLQRIGTGGMGSVWMAEQREPIKRQVALKLIKSGHAGRQVIARFQAERQALAMMDHQHIAKVFEAGTTESGLPYFAMELVQGIPITDFCNRKKLGIPQRLVLFMQVCQAIQHAHTKGIIHRDIKPSNVLVTQYDGKPVVKVIDFGIAKALQADLTDKTCFTEFGQVVGTLAYMSPEQTEMNTLSVDTRTDVFALGVMLYELLTGNTPISRETLETHALLAVLQMIRSLEAPRASDLLAASGPQSGIAQSCGAELPALISALRGDLDAILMKATANERDRRYTTPEALARDIQRFLDNEPIEARPPTVGYRFRKLTLRHGGKLTTAALTLLALMVGTVFSVWKAVEATRPVISPTNTGHWLSNAKLSLSELLKQPGNTRGSRNCWCTRATSASRLRPGRPAIFAVLPTFWTAITSLIARWTSGVSSGGTYASTEWPTTSPLLKRVTGCAWSIIWRMVSAW